MFSVNDHVSITHCDGVGIIREVRGDKALVAWEGSEEKRFEQEVSQKMLVPAKREPDEARLRCGRDRWRAKSTREAMRKVS